MHEAILVTLKNAYERIYDGDLKGYRRCLAEADAGIGALSETETAPGEKQRLLAESLLIAFLDNLRDAEALLAVCQRASALFDGAKSRVLCGGIPMCMGAPDPFACFWNEPGSADRTAERLVRATALYSRFTGAGAGAGVECLFQAQLAYYRGRLEDAASFAYRTVYTAESTSQHLLGMYGARLLAHIAVYQSDVGEWGYALRTIRRLSASAGGDALCAIYHKLIVGELTNLLGSSDEMPFWLRDGSFGAVRGDGPFGMRYRLSNARFPYLVFPFALLGHVRYLIRAHQYRRVVAVYEYQKNLGVDGIPLLGVCLDLSCASALAGLNRREEAKALLAAAADRIAPDGLWLLAAEYAPHTGGLFEEVLHERNRNELPKYGKLTAMFSAGLSKLTRDIRSGELSGELTRREYETAQLAAEGKTNAEIAAELGISVNTVKMHLKSVFEKLQIKRRIELTRVLR